MIANLTRYVCHFNVLRLPTTHVNFANFTGEVISDNLRSIV